MKPPIKNATASVTATTETKAAGFGRAAHSGKHARLSGSVDPDRLETAADPPNRYFGACTNPPSQP